VSVHGEVVGFNELGGDGQGFAIPSNVAANVFRQVLAHGRVIRGTLGINVMPVRKIGRSTGTLVSSVTPGFPGEKAGLKPGDVIISVDGAPTNVQFFEEVPLFYQKIAGLAIGEHVRLALIRNGKPLSLVATITELPRYEGDEDEFRTAGVTVRNLTPSVALADYLPDTNGVQVTGVRPGFPFEAAEPRIQPGDVIRSVDGHAITNIGSLRKALASVKGASYSVSLLRKDESLITVVKPDDNKPAEDGGELPQSWIGVKTQVMVPELATALGVPNQTGFRITEVYPWISRTLLRIFRLAARPS
jgi:S1-C subfamily serine protease